MDSAKVAELKEALYIRLNQIGVPGIMTRDPQYDPFWNLFFHHGGILIVRKVGGFTEVSIVPPK